MFTIYHNGNESKLTLGAKDVENCEEDYFWVDYLKFYNSNLNKHFFADFEITNQTFNNMTIFMDDINEKAIWMPKEFISTILKNFNCYI